jgi:2-polyprenyl-3-methyl-5-hydroxy-6-metoxy-1,4-benzoquinol methylase
MQVDAFRVAEWIRFKDRPRPIDGRGRANVVVRALTASAIDTHPEELMTTVDTTAADAAGGMSRYTFDNSDAQGQNQLNILAAILDEHSVGVLSNLGIGSGWQCLDVGPGAGTISAWLAEQVRPDGHVTALDTDPRHVCAHDRVTVRTADVRTANLPADHYDLIHTRLLLVHLAEREQVLDRLVAALKPGGVLVVSDWEADRRDFLVHAASPAATAAYEAFHTGMTSILKDRGADLGWARRAPFAMRAAGLSEVSTVGHNRLWYGGEPGNLLHISNSHQMQQQLLARGMTGDQLELLRAMLADPETLAYCYWMYTTTGRKPGEIAEKIDT